MKIHVSELEGVALDYAVAINSGACYEFAMKMILDGFSPSSDWGYGGQLLEEWRVNKLYEGEGHCTAWLVDKNGFPIFQDERMMHEGRTFLEAGCRAIVACRLGDEVEIPDELVRWV